MSQQEFTSTPTSLKSADGPVAAVPSWRPRRRKIVWGALWLSLIVVSLWLFGVPSTLLKSQALRQLQRGRADQAMSWLMWARKLGGTDAELEFLTGRTYRILGDMNLTRSHLKTAWQ
ncbi:MAG: hypothetical protein JWM11_4544 [Planctomycetaceae bacterium]|nr:hypothetical protein [Planctomycetaceae bacterium]